MENWQQQTRLINQLGKSVHEGFSLPALDVPKEAPALDQEFLKTHTLEMPILSELSVVRHYTRLSYLNYSIDGGMYPLGSCTMKYNPRINEWSGAHPDFVNLHPRSDDSQVQGALKLYYSLEKMLSEISGFKRVSLQPAAGAQGEYAGLKMIKAYLKDRASQANKILIPDSAHGTNCATAAMCGFEVVTIQSNRFGMLDVEEIQKHCQEGGVAALMLTNPNTVGIFEEKIEEICQIIHEAGALVYCDGANLNAMLGITRPGDAGVDVMHFNQHKTFTTPHGGGGPGCGGVGVNETLEPYLSYPLVEMTQKDATECYYLDYDRPKSIGRLKDYYGHFLMMLRSFTYISELGASGVRKVGHDAVLLANYVREKLKDHYHLAYDKPCMHEVVFCDKIQKENGITTLDIAKRLIDYGYHPPTIYFPLIVPGALMIEPTETESFEQVDLFCQTMIRIAEEAKEENAKEKYFSRNPKSTPVTKVDEVRAARELKLTWRDL